MALGIEILGDDEREDFSSGRGLKLNERQHCRRSITAAGQCG